MFLDFQVYESRSVEDPEVYLPGAGSDHASFIFYAGVPVIDSSFDPVSKKNLLCRSSGLDPTKEKSQVLFFSDKSENFEPLKFFG